MNGPGRPGHKAAVLVGGAVSFAVAVRLLEALRPALLLDPDPGWLVPRFLLWIGLVSATAVAGALAASLFFLWSRSRFCPEFPQPLPFSRATLVLLAVASLAAGALFRFAWLDTLPIPLWIDDVSMIEPALALEGRWRDFRDSIRPAPHGVAEPYGSVGVLYLEIYRVSLALAGTTVFGVRLPSALAGSVSVGTAMLLGRALLPRGGGILAGLALAGMRWSLILSRWGWVAIVLAPVLDVAALLLFAARRRRSLALAATAGVVAGIAAHVYLAAWVGAAALLLIAAWPGESRAREARRLALLFGVGFALAAAPIFLLREGRSFPYFARASDQNVALEVRRSKSPLPLFGAAADALSAPWFLGDPTARHDLPGRSRLGWIGGSLAAVALGCALLRPRREFSAYLLANAAAALAASVVGGRATAPNGFRFAYLADVAAVAIAGGALCVLAMAPTARRRAAALAVTGALAVASAVGARDAIVHWAGSRTTFDAFWGEDTLLARAAARWEAYGTVEVDPALGENELTIAGVRRYRVDPDREPVAGSRERHRRKFRIAAPGAAPREGDRLVERIADSWGREWGRVYGRSYWVR